MALSRDHLSAAVAAARDLMGAGRYGEAAPLLRQLADAAPASWELRLNLGRALLELGDVDAAVDAARVAVQAAPGTAQPLYDLGQFLAAAGRDKEAAAALERAAAMDPDDPRPRLALGYVRLAQGDYPRGWPLYEVRKLVPGQNARPPPLPGEWQGEPLAGKSLLIWPEQGFGDQVQFARFAPVLAAQAATVTLVAEPPLTALFASLGVEVVARTDQLTVPAPDHWTLALSIPFRLGTTLETIPAPPYLHTPADRRAKWAGFAPKAAVGFAWRGRATHPNDANRSLPSPDVLAPLASAGATLVDLTEPLGDDFADLAALVEQLDLVVTVDTALAHVAGALGKPCFVLLPWLRTDWRWLRDRSTSPWYPSVRLFRQPRHGDWTSVIEAVAAAYQELRP